MAKDGKGRRAAMEAALLMKPRPDVGDKVFYYIAMNTAGKKVPDWQLARPVSLYDPKSAPYNADYYLKKIDDWRERFSELMEGVEPPAPKQGELF